MAVQSGARQQKERGMQEDELKKLGPLGLRLLEGLSGHALQIAQLLDMDEISKPKGPEYLMDQLLTSLRPRRQQQARELYEAGAATNGVLSRQPQESMSQYVLRRRAWYRMMTDLSSELKLPDLILAEQLLTNAGIGEDHRLLIRTTLAGKLDFDNVAQELVNQHPRIHERRQEPARRMFGDSRHQGPQPFTWKPWNRGSKGYVKGKTRPLAFYQGHDVYEDNVDENWGEETEYEDASSYSGYMSQHYEDTHDQIEAGTYVEEHLAFMAEEGLDFEDQDACEIAADIFFEAEEEAFWAKKGASSKGHQPFRLLLAGRKEGQIGQPKGSDYMPQMRGTWALVGRRAVPNDKREKQKLISESRCSSFIFQHYFYGEFEGVRVWPRNPTCRPNLTKEQASHGLL